MKYSPDISSEELKERVVADWFASFDTATELKGIDLAVRYHRPNLVPKNFNDEYLFWATVKAASTEDMVAWLTQFVLSLGKIRPFTRVTPPPFLSCCGRERIAFIPYVGVQDIFYQNDFNWNVAPTDPDTREYKQVRKLIERLLVGKGSHVFDFEQQQDALNHFIHEHFDREESVELSTCIQVNKNNFISVFNKWREAVLPSIAADWEEMKKSGIAEGDFFLADLFQSTLTSRKRFAQHSFRVQLDKGFYLLEQVSHSHQLWNTPVVGFRDRRHAHRKFWAAYNRPPVTGHENYIIERRDLLVPQDVRERKGSFFTPRPWVELSQKYLADLLGENWQDEYYIWDCAAGTGNLLAGLTNKHHIWASTLDKADVDVMCERAFNGANIDPMHVFRFDFLNDELRPVSQGGKLPDGLHDVISDPDKREKLIIYINPPYAEGDNIRGEGRKGVHVSRIHDKYQKEMGRASGELFTQFLTRIYVEMPGAMIAQFSKPKHLKAPNFRDFRKFFQAKLEKMFVLPANTFDNVKGEFPIGFHIWDTSKKEIFEHTTADVYDKDGRALERKIIQSYDQSKYISDWLEVHSKNISKTYIGYMVSVGNDFQHQRMLFINSVEAPRMQGGRHTMITQENLIVVGIYFAVRKCIEGNWLNDCDQFLYPNDGWETDTEFQNDCLAYTLFSNNIQSQLGPRHSRTGNPEMPRLPEFDHLQGFNHWLPFTEKEVGSRHRFNTHWMVDFIANKLPRGEQQAMDLFSGNGDTTDNKEQTNGQKPLLFSREAQAVFTAGRNLYRYYHSQYKRELDNSARLLAEGLPVPSRTEPVHLVNASLYDIREFFQGRNAQGKMNARSTDENYNCAISLLRDALRKLAEKIEPKVYEYGFLKG